MLSHNCSNQVSRPESEVTCTFRKVILAEHINPLYLMGSCSTTLGCKAKLLPGAAWGSSENVLQVLSYKLQVLKFCAKS